MQRFLWYVVIVQVAVALERGLQVSPAGADMPAIIMLRGQTRSAQHHEFAILRQQIDALNNEVAARKRAQADLFAQQEWLRVTLESIGDAVIATDPQGRVVFMNPVAERLTGWRQTNAAGRPLAEVFRIVSEVSGESIDNPCQKAIRSGHVVMLAEHSALIARFDDIYPIEYSAAPIRDEAGRIFGAVLVFHDVSERCQAEQQLKALNETLEQRVLERTAQAEERAAELSAIEQRLTMALEASKAGYYEHTIPLERGHVSRGWAKLLGYELHDLPPLPGLLPWWESRLHEDDVQQVMQSYRDFLAGSCEHFDIEYRIRHRCDGWRCQRMVSRAVQREPSGRASVVAGLVFDITEQKLSEQKLQNLNRTLELRATQLRTLAAQLTNAEQRERRRLAQLLHDHLQQILAAAQLNLGSISECNKGTPLRQELSRIEHLIHEAIEVGRSLTVELSPPVLSEGSLTTALEWLGQWVESQYGLEVRIEAEHEIKVASEYLRVLLFYATRELLFNVIKHAGVDLAYIRVGQQAGGIKLEVIDHGAGLDPSLECNDRLDRFGLFSLRERLGACGGHLEITGTIGQGTQVRLWAPIETTAAEHPTSAPIAPRATPSGIARDEGRDEGGSPHLKRR